MDLLKKNIHMDRIRNRTVTQLTLEEILNVPDQKPDISSLNFEKGTILIDEVKAAEDYVRIRGRMSFQLLYHTKEDGCSLVSLEGNIPFEERINMQGVTASDNAIAEGKIEDLSINIINSRKINIQAVVTLDCWVDELYDEEVPIGIYGDETVEYRRVSYPFSQVMIRKNDIFRVKEEITLPSNLPNIFQILWSNVSLGDVDFRLMDGKINLSADVKIFVLFEGEGEDHPVLTFEQTIPVAGSLECHGCHEGMIPDIRCEVSPQEHSQQILTVKPDQDGEERNIGVDVVLDIFMKLYEEENVEIITDIYGVTKEVDTDKKPCMMQSLLSRVGGKTRVSDRVRVKSGYGILQLLHSEGIVMIDEQEATDGGILLTGCLHLHILYITGNDEAPYGSYETRLPFRYRLEMPDMEPQDMGMVRSEVEQLQVTMLDGEEMDVKALLSFHTICFRNVPMEVLQDVKIRDLETAVLNSLPGMAIYVVKPGDNLWSIGRKYYVPVDSLRNVNKLDSDELKVGQKLLVVKGI